MWPFHSRKAASLGASLALALACLVMSSGSALATCSYGKHGGTWSPAHAQNYGVRADFTWSNTVGNWADTPSGVGLHHYVRLDDDATSYLFVAFGYYSGDGILADSGCLNHHDDNKYWMEIYFYGNFGQACYDESTYWTAGSGFGTQIFAIKRDSVTCGGGGYDAVLNGSNVETCLTSFTHGDVSSQAFEQGSATARRVDVDYDNIYRLDSGGTWHSWTSSDGCATSGYDLVVHADDHVEVNKA